MSRSSADTVPSMVAIIEKKKAGRALSTEELRHLCRGVARGTLPDYQVAAWLMATWFNGMDAAETLALTREMVATGETLDWSDLGRPVVDKHSTGGVGDKTSIALVPLVAAAGLAFAKMSGRGLGHTGGTLDKLESIPRFHVDLTADQLRLQVERIGCALVGQNPSLVPADGALYALRDVTATVDSLPLIASSVMSKKLAAGATTIVLDVKHGSGAFMPDRDGAVQLARAMVEIGIGSGRRVRAVLSGMEEPLGRSVGNAVEVREAMRILRGEGPDDLRSLTLELGVQLLLLSGVQSDREDARLELGRVLESGEALQTLARLIEAQGGDPGVVDDESRLPRAPVIRTVRAERSGWVGRVHARSVADVVLRLGGGRRVKGEPIDPRVGVQELVKVGEEVRRGDRLAEIHAAAESDAAEAEALLLPAIQVVASPEELPAPVSHEVIGSPGDAA